MIVVWQHVPLQVWARLRVFFFFLSGFVFLYQAAFNKKNYYVSHIVKSELRVMGSPHTDAGGASKASPTFSKKSMIHAVLNVFWCFFLLCFQLICSPCSLCSSLCRLTAACCSLHANQFIKFAVSTGPEQSICCNLSLILRQPDLYFVWENTPIKVHVEHTLMKKICQLYLNLCTVYGMQ